MPYLLSNTLGIEKERSLKKCRKLEALALINARVQETWLYSTGQFTPDGIARKLFVLHTVVTVVPVKRNEKFIFGELNRRLPSRAIFTN